MISINMSELSLPREIVVSREVIEALADNGCCPEHDAEIRRKTIAELLIKLHEIMDEKEKEYGVACIESNCDTLTEIEEWMHEQVAENKAADFFAG